MQISLDTRIEFLHDVWDRFSNTDSYMPPSIIYNDWMELMRLSTIYDPENQKDSLLDKNTVERIYDKHATEPWKFGIMCIPFNSFANAIKELSK